MINTTIAVFHKMAAISGFTKKRPIRVSLDMGIIDNHHLKPIKKTIVTLDMCIKNQYF